MSLSYGLMLMGVSVNFSRDIDDKYDIDKPKNASWYLCLSS